MDENLRAVALATRGFMPADEGDALWRAGMLAGSSAPGLPFVEVGSYCGRSTVWLGAAARSVGVTVHAVDHHGGSEENQPGWQWHEPDLVDPSTGRIDTLPHFLATIERAGLADVVVPVIGGSVDVASRWTTPAGLVFIDGGHGREVARADWRAWSPHVADGGVLVIHDVFDDPADGGTSPREEIYEPAVAAGFVEVDRCGSLRVLTHPRRS
jgi:hypothetical protein